jgi:hypothetical protein
MTMKKLAGLAVAMLLLAMAMPAAADMIVTVRCSAGDLLATQEFSIVCNGTATEWVLADPVDLMAGDVRLATVKRLEIQSDLEPFVNLNFAVQAGAADTSFDINSAVVSFSPLTNPQAYASAGVTLTSDSGGATITGLLGDGRTYQARYNTSSVFSNLVNGFSVAGNLTDTRSDRQPASGFDTISGSVSSIQSEFKFILSAEDQASGTSRFEVTPEPATLSLLALGGLVFLRRRRHA